MNRDKVEMSLEKLDSGLNKYLNIMDTLHKTDVSKDMEFQKKYNGFYRMRQRTPDFYQDYFEFMEQNKNKDLTFEEILIHFYEKFGRIESSFSSKLLATINPDMPVWDSVVIANLKLKKPSQYSKNRLSETIKIYNKISNWYHDFLKTDEALEWLYLFNEKYADSQITDTKKIDLILWQIREE